jgi:hypothetical protein
MRIPFLSVLVFLSTIPLAFGQDTNFPIGPQYLQVGSPLLAVSIATPTLAITDPPLEKGADNATADLIPGARNQTVVPQFPPPNLLPVYYGEVLPRAVEANSATSTSEISLTEITENLSTTGVEEASVIQELRARGDQIVFVAAGVYRRANTIHLARVYTNADIDALRGGS